nr:hypothetical protein [Tanacetum cinerariifolium]
MNDSMIELHEMFQAWLQQQEQVVNIDSYSPEPSQCRKIPIYYDDDGDEESSTPLRDIISGLPLSDEVIKSSVEDLVLIPSESEGIPDNMCDVPLPDDPSTLDISKDQFEDFSDSNNDSTSIDDDSFSIDDINYIEASSPHSELVSLEEVKDFHLKDEEIEDDILREKLSKINLLIAKIEALNAYLTPSFDFVLKSPSSCLIPVEDNYFFSENFKTFLELETFKFDMEEKNSGSTTIYADISLPDFDHFYFKIEPDPVELNSNVDSGIRENVLSATNMNLSPEDDQSPLFAYV